MTAVQRGGGLQSAVNEPPGGLETAAPLASPRYFDPNVEIDIHGSRLPHWDQSSTLCFVTFRLADSLPQEKLAGFVARRDAWISVHPRPWDEQTTVEYASEFGDQLETWLDAGYGACILQDSQVRGVVEDSLLHFNGERYILDAFVVMPNHVHALFAPMLGQNIAGIVKTWKSFSARRINALRGISGPLWQRNYWDTLIRNAKHHRRVRKYIFDNSPTLARISQRGGGLQSAAKKNGGLETAAPLADASVPAAVQRGGGLQSAVNVPPGGLETAAPLADASVPVAVQRGGGLQSAVNVRSGGLETAAPLADASVPAAVQRGGGLQSAVNVPPGGLETASPMADASVPAAVQRGGGLQSAVKKNGGLETASPMADAAPLADAAHASCSTPHPKN